MSNLIVLMASTDSFLKVIIIQISLYLSALTLLFVGVCIECFGFEFHGIAFALLFFGGGCF